LVNQLLVLVQQVLQGSGSHSELPQITGSAGLQGLLGGQQQGQGQGQQGQGGQQQGLLEPVQGLLGGLLGGQQQGQQGQGGQQPLQGLLGGQQDQPQQPGQAAKQSNSQGLLQHSGKTYD
jgi:hypothetical protein